MGSTGTCGTGTMAVRDRRLRDLAAYLCAVTLIVIPWSDGGRAPAGQAALVLLVTPFGIAEDHGIRNFKFKFPGFNKVKEYAKKNQGTASLVSP